MRQTNHQFDHPAFRFGSVWALPLEHRAVSLNRLTALMCLLTRRIARRGVITIRAGQRRQRTHGFGPSGGILRLIGHVAPFERCPTSPFTTRLTE